LVSVIIPYNKDRGYLKDAIKSLEGQTYTDWELILSHGDESLGVNMNRGVARSKGEYIKLLSEDDMLPPDSLKILTEGIVGYDFVYANAENFGELDGWPRFHDDHTVTFEEMLHHNCMHGGTTLYRKDVFLEVGGYDEHLYTAEEYDLHLRLLKAGYKHRHIPAIVYLYRKHEDNKSSNKESFRKRISRHAYIKQIQMKYV
jgi:glycosyltransferase involved in cell wall biosynthesis